jgi:hypothetical protein
MSEFYVVHIAPVAKGDFGPSGYAVWSDDYITSRVVENGDVVEAIGPIETSYEEDYTDNGLEKTELSYRKVRLEDGFEGMVGWHEYDDRSGFEKL